MALETAALKSATGGVSVSMTCKLALVTPIAKLEKSGNTEVENDVIKRESLANISGYKTTVEKP